MVSPELREKIIACNRSFHDRFAASYDGCYKNHTGEPQFFEKLTSEGLKFFRSLMKPGAYFCDLWNVFGKDRILYEVSDDSERPAEANL